MSWLSKVVSYLPGGSGYGSLWDSTVGSVWNDFTGKSAVEKQNQYNMQMWNMQNEYNTPANQVARYRAAGLNPNLIYGNGSSSAGNASSAPDMTAHQGSARKALDLAQFVLQLKNMKAQNTNLNAQTGNINAQTSQHLADVEYKMALVDFYKKHGYFPGQTNAPTNVVKEVLNAAPIQKAQEGLANFLGGVVGAVTSDNPGYNGRAMDLAIKSADRKKLNGKARADYIEKFVSFYKLYH